jgi:hypothetical protein
MCAERVYLLPQREKKEENTLNKDNLKILTNWIQKQIKKKEMNEILEKFFKSSLRLNEELRIIYPEIDIPGSSIYEMLEYLTDQTKKQPIDYIVFKKYVLNKKDNKINLPNEWKKI